jgi:O-antigen ligase
MVAPDNTRLPSIVAQNKRHRMPLSSTLYDLPSENDPRPRQDYPTAVLAWTMMLVPALGVPSLLMLQDTLKSALAAFGVLIAALVFFWHQRGRTEPLRWHGLVWLPVVLMVYALGSMGWSHTYLAGVEAIRWFVLGLLLWLGLNTLTRENLPMLVWGIHLGLVVASVWTVLQFWWGWDFFPQGAPPASTFINRNFFAEYAVTALPFSVWALARMRPSHGLRGLCESAGAALSVVLPLIAVLMTGTRSALLALVVLAPVLALILIRYRAQFAFTSWNRRHQLLVGVALVVGVAVLGSVPSGNAQILQEQTGATALERSFLRTTSLTKRTEYTEGSFSIRATLWMATARMMSANPLTGVGAGAWEVQIPLYQRVDTTLETDYYAHNEYLQLLSEYGLMVGGGFLAFLLAYLLKAAGTTWRLSGTHLQEAPLRATALASLLALLIVSTAGFPWHLAACGVLMALCLAMLAGSDARLGNHAPFFAAALRWRPAYAAAALTVLVGCTVLTLTIIHQAAQAERKLVQAIAIATVLRRPHLESDPAWANRKTELLEAAREGIAINPHYRKLTPLVADMLAASGDLANAIWIWESVVASRPHITSIWSDLALSYAQLDQHEQAQHALREVQRLKPDALGTRTLEVTLLSRAGHGPEAARRLNAYYDRGEYDYDMVQAGYAIGLNAQLWALAIRSLELRNQTWPEFTADGFFRLGNVYAEPAVHDDAKALAAFRAGLASVPAEQKENFRRQVPDKYRPLI